MDSYKIHKANQLLDNSNVMLQFESRVRKIVNMLVDEGFTGDEALYFLFTKAENVVDNMSNIS